jgi:hypothetical protein
MYINKEVDVLSYYFGRGSRPRCFPKKIELEGRELDFTEGLRCLVKRGQDFIQIFNMTDGRRAYRLSFEPENRIWTLLSQKVL